MRKVIAAEFVTLDGVMEAPGRADSTLPNWRGWSEPYVNEEVGAALFSQMNASDTLLLGRNTYETFAAFWPTMPNENPIAQRMNGYAKVVVSTTLDKAEWNNSTLIKENVQEEIARLKQQPGKDILIIGSGELVQSLTEAGLVDEYHLMVCPVVLGTGKRLFKDETGTKALKLGAARPFSSGMLMLVYTVHRN